MGPSWCALTCLLLPLLLILAIGIWRREASLAIRWDALVSIAVTITAAIAVAHGYRLR